MSNHKHSSIRSIFEDFPESGDPNPTLRDLLQDDEAPFIPLNPVEDTCWVALPGDSLEHHLFPDAADPIPYLYVMPSKLRAMYDDPETPEAERRKIVKAMHMIGMNPSGPETEPCDYSDHIAPPGNSVRRADPFSR